MGQRCIDIRNFSCDPELLSPVNTVKFSHVIQPVGEANQDHPYITGHGNQEASEVFPLIIGFLGVDP